MLPTCTASALAGHLSKRPGGKCYHLWGLLYWIKMSKLSLWRNSSTFSNLGTGCSFLLETLCLHAGIAERSKSFQIQNIQDFFDLVQMEGSTSPMCRALLKAVNFSFQKRMTNLFPCSSCLSLFFRALPCLQKGKRSMCYSWFHHNDIKPSTYGWASGPLLRARPVPLPSHPLFQSFPD